MGSEQWNNAGAGLGAITNQGGGGFWDELDQVAAPTSDPINQQRMVTTNPLDFSQWRGTNQTPMQAPPQFGGGSPSIADLTQYFQQAGPADGDPGYWAGVAAEKIGKGANVNDTLSYLTGRADFSTLGGDGRPSAFGGGMGTYQPLGPMSYNPSNFSNYSAPTVNDPEAFKYTGPGLQAPSSFSYDPNAPGPNGGPPQWWNEQEYLAKNPDIAKAVSEGWMPSGYQHYQQFGKNEQRPGVSQAPISSVSNFQAPTPTQGPGPFQSDPLQSATPFQANSQVPTPTQIGGFSGDGTISQGDRIGQFSANGQITPGERIGAFDQSGQINAGTPFSYGELANAPTYSAGGYTPTTAADLQNDPGYQERVKSALQALEQSAAANGTLFSTGTSEKLMARAQEMASQEFAAADARRYRDFTTGESLRRDAAGFNEANRENIYGMNAGTQQSIAGMNQAASMAAQQGSFGNALAGFNANAGATQANNANAQSAQQGTFGNALAGFNANAAATQVNNANTQNAQQGTFSNALAGYGANASTTQTNNAANLGAQQAQYGQDRDVYALNEANRQSVQGQQYGQERDAYALNADNLYRQNESTQNNARANYALDTSTRLGAANQNFNQQLAQYQTNVNTPLAYQNQAFQQQYQPWQQGAANSLQAGSINASAATAANALNANQEQNRYQAAWNDYQSQVNQGQFGAGLGMQHQQLGLQQQQFGLAQNNQNFNQGLTGYLTNYQTQVQDPWNRNYQLAQLGQNATQDLGNTGTNYGNLYGQGVTGIGNAQAAGQVGAANAYTNLYGNLANLAVGGYGNYLMNRPQGTGYATPPNNGVLP